MREHVLTDSKTSGYFYINKILVKIVQTIKYRREHCRLLSQTFTILCVYSF